MPTEVTITISSTDGASQNVDRLGNDSLGAAPSPLPLDVLGSPSEAAGGLGETGTVGGEAGVSPGEAPAPVPLDEILGASSAQDDAPAPAPLQSSEADSGNDVPAPAPLEEIQPKNKKR